MNKWIYTATVLLCTSVVAIAQEGMTFFKGSFQEALKRAEQEKKVLFVDFYATWCVPCKKMEKTVFTDPKVGKYFNEKFINLQLDAEQPDIKPIAKQYKVEAFPTMSFIAPDGKLLSVITGFHGVDELLKAAQTVMGDVVGVPQLYEAYRKDNSNLEIQQQILLMAPQFLMGQEGVEADKWSVRLSKMFRSYIKAKKGEALINKEDYVIIQTLSGDEPAIKEELIAFINNNLPAWRAAVGDAPAYYVVEYNDAKIEDLAKSGKASYQEHIEKIRGDYKAAYEAIPQSSMGAYLKSKTTADALYKLYKDKDALHYIKEMQAYFDKVGCEVRANEYAKVAQELYFAVGDKLPKEAHLKAIAWLSLALKSSEITIMDRVNFITMMGDSEKAMGNYDKAKAYYNQAYAESLQLVDMEMVQAMIQGKLQMRLSELELLQK